MKAAPTTIHEHIAAARERFIGAGIEPDDAALDARVLAEHILGWDTAKVLTDGQSPAAADFIAHYDAATARRVRREPVAYITGVKEFWNLTLEVSPAVLIPRPETEGVIEQVVARIHDRAARLEIADVCTGSGCLAIALAVEYPRAVITASDISRGALAIASRNGHRHAVSNRITFVEGDLMAECDGPFDLVVSNPPYVPEGDRLRLQPELTFEPATALFGGDDGIAVIRRLIDQVPARLKPAGWLMFEFGFGQEQTIRRLIPAAPGLRMMAIQSDFSGIPRIAIAVRV